MFYLLIDTCVWLDLAKDPHQKPLLDVLEELVKLRETALILPRIIIDEFQRNRQRVLQDATRSVSSSFKRVKDLIDKHGDPSTKRKVIEQLNNVDHRLPTLGTAVAASLDNIERLFSVSAVIEVSDSVKVRAAERALNQKAPFHRPRNGIADAILLEVYADAVSDVRSMGHRFAFVTHNVKDFSLAAGNDKSPHPDIAPMFSKRKSLYFINLAEAVRRVRPDLVSELMMELGEWEQPQRSLSEILEAEHELFDKIWYDRHQGLRGDVESGKVCIVEKETFPTPEGEVRPISRDIWKGARAAARKVEAKYGKDNLGPWTDFEWGMINGKLSALRWVLGDDWDMLDT